MSPVSPASSLADTVLSFNLPEESIAQSLRQIHDDVLDQSPHIRVANFTAIHPGDLQFLFRAYDQRFCAGLCAQALEGRRIRFRLSPRMTIAGGKTTRFTARSGEVSYEIAVAVTMLFDAFRETDRRITVTGLECQSRLEALQRIFEHELVHLVEQLCWRSSNCAAARFQDIAHRLFRHRAHTHNLITRRERAAELDIRVGARVTFTFEGVRLAGRVNRVTQRATVLVEDPAGRLFNDGLRYKIYYVPIQNLETAPDR